MIAYDIIVPLVALGVALGAAIVARQATKHFDAKHGGHQHPAE